MKRRFSAPRTLRPTREGWWCLLATVGVGFAAVSTGNNLLYLLEAMLLGLIVVSGLLSEMSMRGLHLALRVPDEVFAGRPALFAVAIVNGKRRLPSYSLALAAPGHGEIVRYLPRLRSREERLLAWETTFPVRGRERLPALLVTARVPFVLFAKSAAVGGRDQDRRLLPTLALYDPSAPAVPVLPPGPNLRVRAGEREIRFHLGW